MTKKKTIARRIAFIAPVDSLRCLMAAMTDSRKEENSGSGFGERGNFNATVEVSDGMASIEINEYVPF